MSKLSPRTPIRGPDLTTGEDESSRLRCSGHPMTGNANAPIVEAGLTRASGTARREAAGHVGADKPHDVADFMAALRDRRAQGASTIFGAAARPARISAKARAPSESGRISVQSSGPRRPAKIAAAVSRKSDALYV